MNNGKQVRTKRSWCPLITRCGGSFSQEKPGEQGYALSEICLLRRNVKFLLRKSEIRASRELNIPHKRNAKVEICYGKFQTYILSHLQLNTITNTKIRKY